MLGCGRDDLKNDLKGNRAHSKHPQSSMQIYSFLFQAELWGGGIETTLQICSMVQFELGLKWLWRVQIGWCLSHPYTSPPIPGEIWELLLYRHPPVSADLVSVDSVICRSNSLPPRTHRCMPYLSVYFYYKMLSAFKLIAQCTESLKR